MQSWKANEASLLEVVIGGQRIRHDDIVVPGSQVWIAVLEDARRAQEWMGAKRVLGGLLYRGA